MSDEELLKEILKKIDEGKTLGEIETELEKTKTKIRKLINEIGKTNPQKLAEINKKIKRNAHLKAVRANTIIPEDSYSEYIDKIEKLVFDGLNNTAIIKELHLPNGNLKKIIDTLNNPNSSIYDEKRYKAIILQQEKNKLNSIKNSNFTIRNGDKKFALTKLMANNEITFFEVCRALNYLPANYFHYLISITDVELKSDLEPFFLSLGINLDEKPTKKLSDYKYKTLKEIVLVALTYRVSFKSIAKLFKVSFTDVFNTFYDFDSYSFALSQLFNETFLEGEIEEKRALYYAKEYYKKRKEIFKKLNDAKEVNNGSLIEQYTNELNILTSTINDTLLIEGIKNSSYHMTKEERDMLARFQLKYYLSNEVCAEILSIDSKTVFRATENLRKEDRIFDEKTQMREEYYNNDSLRGKQEKSKKSR